MVTTPLLFLVVSFLIGAALIWVRDHVGSPTALVLCVLTLLGSIVASALLFRSIPWSIAAIYGTSVCLFVGTRIHELRRGRNALFD